MMVENLAETLKKHALWSVGDPCGARADLCGADLTGADLAGVNLRGASLALADLAGADLCGVDLTGADLGGADLAGADLTGAFLCRAVLSGADFTGADLHGATLCEARLSGATGLLCPIEWIGRLPTDDLGVIVWKRIGPTQYAPSPDWVIEPGSIIEEVVNPDRCTECGCGVNFGTEAWCRGQYRDADLWRCRIRWTDLPGVVVPYGTDGKARCARLELIEIVEGGGS